MLQGTRQHGRLRLNCAFRGGKWIGWPMRETAPFFSSECRRPMGHSMSLGCRVGLLCCAETPDFRRY